MIEYFEPVIQLDLPTPPIDLPGLAWHPYNPRKQIQRWGASLTSLDGKTDGVPDLDSLLEYNKENGTGYREKDFNQKTEQFRPFDFLEDHFDLGRSHVLRLGTGGFFPYHRDFDPDTFRLLYTIQGCQSHNLVWILNNQVIQLQDQTWYYINTKMPHSVFSFFGSEFAVFNVLHNDKAQKSLLKLMHVK